MNFLFRREMVVGEPIRITIPSSQAKNGGSQGSHPTLQRAQTIGQQQFPKSSNPSNEKPDSQTTHQKILSRFANGQGPKGPIVPGSVGQASGHTRQKSDSSQNGQPGFNVSIVGPTGSNQPVNKSNQNTGNIIILLIAFSIFKKLKCLSKVTSDFQTRKRHLYLNHADGDRRHFRSVDIFGEPIFFGDSMFSESRYFRKVDSYRK